VIGLATACGYEVHARTDSDGVMVPWIDGPRLVAQGDSIARIECVGE